MIDFRLSCPDVSRAISAVGTDAGKGVAATKAGLAVAAAASGATGVAAGDRPSNAGST